MFLELKLNLKFKFWTIWIHVAGRLRTTVHINRPTPANKLFCVLLLLLVRELKVGED